MAAKWSAGRLRTFVAERAGYICEYCRSPLSFSLQPFVVEHIVPSSKGGTDDPDNLACDCGGCNSYKYNKTEALDPASGRSVPLYHPRRQKWTDHFAWHDNFLEIIGLTPSGRATVEALRLNRPELINIRRLLILGNLHPPKR
jgi:HNH endonuclease